MLCDYLQVVEGHRLDALGVYVGSESHLEQQCKGDDFGRVDPARLLQLPGSKYIQDLLAVREDPFDYTARVSYSWN